MKTLCLTFLACIFSVSFANAEAPNSLSDEEAKTGWKLLFDGKTTEGWRNYGKPDGEVKNWKVANGAITRVSGGGDLITVGKYEHFDFIIEFSMPKPTNSGIIFRAAETDKPSYATGPEIQVLGEMKAGGKTSAGSCYALYAPTKDVLKPIGEWNELRLTIHPDNKVEHFMNGEKVCEYQIGSDDWNERVAASKFSKMPGFGTVSKGHICLQDHGGEVWYRNIRIRELK